MTKPRGGTEEGSHKELMTKPRGGTEEKKKNPQGVDDKTPWRH